MPVLSRHQLDREATPLLKRLAAEGCYLEREHGTSSSRTWGLMTPRNAHARAVLTCEPALIAAMEAAGWIERSPLGRLVLSNGGRAVLAARGIRVKCAGGPADRPAGSSAGLNASESPLAWLAGRKGPDGNPLISPDMLQAGERLRRDFETGQMGERVTSQWGASIMPGARGRSGAPDTGLNRSERAMAARQRVWRALEHAGPGLSSVLLEVCCLASGLEAAERHLNWPRRSAKLVLLIALQRLAQHYGYGEARTSRRAAGLQVWGLPDYRPDLLGHLADEAASHGNGE